MPHIRRDRRSQAPVRVITFGTFDLFHVGHLNILRRARKLGDCLIVGVSSDDLNHRKKAKLPVIRQEDRMAIVAGIRYVDEVFVEDSLELKGEYIREHRADVLVMGDDWQGRFDQFSSLCQVVYLPRTPDISSSGLKATMRVAS
jgi:glycerol-3-phosphate cytidylyltransferase